MSNDDPLPDEALVVRCGEPPFAQNPLIGACTEHEGVYGFSVQCAALVSFEQLASACRNNSVGRSSVGEIRQIGYDVVVTSGLGHHATVVVPIDWTAKAADGLTNLFQAAKNPAPKRRS